MTDSYIILEIEGVERTFALGGSALSIGRGRANEVSFTEGFVSARHGRIFLQGKSALFEDLDSRNGTFVDGTFIRGRAVPLQKKGRIVFGAPSGPEIRYRLTDLPADESRKEILFRKGYEYLKEEHYRRAFTCFEQAIDKGPVSPAAYYYAGFAASKINELDRAIVHFEQYLTVMPRDAGAMIDLGKLYERKGLYRRAAVRYRKVLEINPDDTSVLMRLKDLDRFEPVDSSARPDRSTEDILGSDLIDTVETRHFMVTYNVARHGRRLNDALKILEEAYERSGRHLEICPQQKVPVLLASEESTLSIDDMSVAGSASREGIRVLVSPKTMAESLFLNVQLIHEYTHYLLDLMNPDGKRIPWWLHEGLAQYESQNMRIDSEILIARMLHDSALIPMEVLETGVFDDEIPGLIQLAYTQSYSLVEFCTENYGWDAIAKLLKGLTSGKEKGAYRDAGMKYGSLEASWESWLRGRLGRSQAGRTQRL